MNLLDSDGSRTWAEVELGPWEPRFEIAHRRLFQPDDLRTLAIGGGFAPLVRRALAEAGILGGVAGPYRLDY